MRKNIFHAIKRHEYEQKCLILREKRNKI